MGRRKRRSGILGKLVILLLAAIGVAVLYRREILHQLDEAWLDGDRNYRLSRYLRGRPLEGTPDLARLDARLAAAKLKLGAPVLVRIFKRESELELWLARAGRFHHFATYPICRWSGRLGPKLKEGDRQSPEGFYTVDQRALNPNSRWHRSFNLGFPNSFDRMHGRTGSFIMVHGGCGSVGCFAMTDPVVDEIWRFVTEALAKGQKRFQVQVFPFRMTDDALSRHTASPWIAFWRDLKVGHDLFERSGLPPRVVACNDRYLFVAGTSESIDGAAPVLHCRSLPPRLRREFRVDAGG